MPAMKIQILEENARRINPRHPRNMPVIMVGSGLAFFTIRLTNTCNKIMVPALTMVTYSGPNFSGMPIEENS